MGTITINLSDEAEALFRETVKEERGTGKGILGKAVEEALKKWIEEKRQEEIAKRQLALLKKGIKMGKIKWRREEIYDRNW